MAKVNKLSAVIEFYTSLLHETGLEVRGEGMLSFTTKDGDSKPVTISGNRLCLPTQALLQEANWDQRVVFHPLSEQFSTSLSPVLNAFKSYLQVALTRRYMHLAVAIAELASDPTRHKNLGSKIGKVLKEIGPMDTTAFNNTTALTRKVLDAPETRLVNILMRSGAKEKVMRATAITHPIVEGLVEAANQGDKTFMKVSGMRKQDLQPIANLLTYVVGGIEEKVYGSNDRTAPYFHSLLLAWKECATHINEVIALFAPKVPAVKAIQPFELDWVEKLEDFSKFAASHHVVAPALPGSKPMVEDEEDPLEAKRRDVFEASNIEMGNQSETRSSRSTAAKDDSVPWDNTPTSSNSSGGTSLNAFLSRGRRDEEETPRGRGRGDGDRDRDYDRGYDRGYERSSRRDYDDRRDSRSRSSGGTSLDAFLGRSRGGSSGRGW